ncbi:MAG: TIGR04141 family sporadically distributed protein [Chitinophagaceae bacterium]|nr:TIGR04141 family sporadically distributed protein [Chitinophagaceae bacterium]
MPTRIAICLLEDNITDLNAPNLMGGQPLTKIALNKADSEVTLYLKKSNDSIPDWGDIVQGFANFQKGDIVTASSGAILFVKHKKRILACCFGTSVANINKENIVRDFGLAVAFNRIPKRNYKGIETYTLTENPITNSRSAAMPSSQSNFNLDTYLETITELSGKYYSSTRSILVKGKEFFSTPAPLLLDEIKKLCASLVVEYEKTIKNSEFKKLTAVSKVKSKKLIELLDDKLCESLNKKVSNIYLVDYQHYEDLQTYGLTPKGEKLTELELNDLYNSLNKGQKFTTAYLKTKRIAVFNSDSQQIDEWPLYRCLFTEFSLNIGGHIFYKGNWYEVQKRYLQDLKGFISTYELQASKANLPLWDGKKKEEDYNIEAANKIKGQCWDKVLYSHPDFSYGIEFCDVLVPNYVIHVKKLASSSLNSHLLMQTYVSAQLLKADPLIRNWIKSESKARFKKNIFLKPSNDFKDPNVKYLIVLMTGTTGKSLADSLPFFSLVTFNMMIRRVTQLDFNVEICMV